MTVERGNAKQTLHLVTGMHCSLSTHFRNAVRCRQKYRLPSNLTRLSKSGRCDGRAGLVEWIHKDFHVELMHVVEKVADPILIAHVVQQASS